MRPFKEDGTWDDNQRKVYCRDENGNRIYDPKKRLYACETIATTDWNRREKAELWRSSWAELCNQCLARNDVYMKIDHRPYERQGIPLKPTIHLGPSVTETERRGIRTEKGNYNRAIMEERSMMRQVHARVSNLHGWSKNHAKGRKRFEKRHARKPHAYHTAINYFAEHDLSMEDWNPPHWKSRLEKACKERYDCECVQTDVKKEPECLKTIRQEMNEMHRMHRRAEQDRGER